MAKKNNNPISEFASGLEGVPKIPKTKTKKKRPKGKSQKWLIMLKDFNYVLNIL